MKKFFKKAAVVLLSALFLVGMYSPVLAASTSKVVVHCKDGASWGSLSVYNWGDDGETAGVWPGTAMTSEGDGWFTYTFETKCDLNLVFSGKGGKPQSGNLDKITPDAGEVWVVIGKGTGDGNNYSDAATVEAKLYKTPEAGWPSAVAKADTAKTAAKKTVTVSKKAADTEKASTPAAAKDTTEATAAVTAAPKTGESQSLTFAFLGLAVLSGAAVIIMGKKKRQSEN